MLKVYSVFDKAVRAFDRPFYCRADGEAVRVFQDAVNASDSPFFKHPGDYELYVIGTFDPSTGALTAELYRMIGALELANKVA